MSRAGRLRVMIVGINWPPETFLARLFQGLMAAGIHICVATSRKPDRDWLAIPQFSWLPIPQSDGPTLRRLGAAGRQLIRETFGGAGRIQASGDGPVVGGSDPPDSQYLRRLYARENWDVLYCPWNTGAIAHLPLFDRAPVLISCRGAQINIAPHNPERIAIRDGLRLTFEKAAAVHCVSAAIRDEAAQYGLDPAKAVVIYPAVDPDFFQPARNGNFPSDQLRLITTGSLIWRKGYEYMLLALRSLQDQGIPAHLSIIGDGPERSRLLYTIHDLGLVHAVELCGKLSPSQVRQRLQSADGFVLASLSEGVSNAVLEAMACGLPVVTTAVGGMPEAISDGVEGYLVPPRDPSATANALASLWHHPEKRRHMGLAGRARVERCFSLADQVHAFAGLLRRIG